MKWIIKCFKNYAVFNGRSGREEYAHFIFFVIFLQFFSLCIDFMIGWELPNIINGISWYPLFETSRIITVLPVFGVMIRRLHDINRSGWWILMAFTFIGLIPLFYWGFFIKGDEDKNQYGLKPLL